MTSPKWDVCIAGGGPAGMVAGLLFARAGAKTILLEKHRDFFRDFRGDTVHPSTLRLFSELGLLSRLLQCPHNKIHGIDAYVGGRRLKVADFSGFDPRWNFIALMPQWDFLDFVAREARNYSNFTLVMEAEADGLIVRDGRIEGLSYRSAEGQCKVEARLVVAADGRHSVLREKAELPLQDLGAPMDVFWFRVPKNAAAENETTGVFAAGRIMALIDRGDYWQCGYVFAKGDAEGVRARGLEAFRKEISQVAPMLGRGIAAITEWDQVKLLTVGLDRLERWHRPGLLVIGDAAHTMSPVGGVGINVAVQDAVAAANVLAGPLARGDPVDALLHKVRKRRLLAVRATQGFQKAAQARIIAPLLKASGPFEPPLFLRLLDRFAFLRRLPAAFLGFGLKAEHVRSPASQRVHSA